MSSNFEWKTEEDSDWEEAPTPKQPPKPSRKRPWLIILIILCLIAGAGYLLRQRVNQALEATAQEVEDDILSTHSLIWRTAKNKDNELFKSLISGVEPQWTNTQLELVSEGNFGNPPFLGWQADSPELTATDEVTITLAPDLQAAELHMIQVYTATNPMGAVEQIRLNQTAVYRQGKERWLLAPPHEEFWGEWLSTRGQIVTVAFPERDEEIAQALAADLDELVVDMCSQVAGLACPSDLRVLVRFDNESGLLLGPQQATEVFAASLNVQLPAPSLMGIPLDETSYDAMYRVYGEKLATAVITNLVGYECCAQARLYEGLLDKQLADLGLKQWPLTQTIYDELFNDLLDGRYDLDYFLRSSLASSTEDQLRQYAFVEFLENRLGPDVPLAALQSALHSDLDLPLWLSEQDRNQLTEPFSEADFQQFIYTQTAVAQASKSTIPFPHSRVQLICDQTDENQTAFYQLNLETNQWSQVFRNIHLPNQWTFTQKMYNRPNSYMIVTNSESTGWIINYTLVENNEVLDILTVDQGELNYFMNSDPNGRYLLFFSDSSNRSEYKYKLLDKDSCDASGCDIRPFAYEIVWSPSGSQTLLQQESPDGEGSLIFLGDDSGHVVTELGPGSLPFWLNRKTYGFLQSNDEGTLQLVTAVTDTNEPIPLLTAVDLLETVPEAERPDSLQIVSVYPSIDDTHSLFVRAAAVSGNENEYALFEITLSTDFTAVENIDYVAFTSGGNYISLSQDRKWIIWYDFSVNYGRIFAVNRETGEQRVLLDQQSNVLGIDWSEDGDWYLLNGEKHFIMGSLSTGFETYVFYNYEDCDQIYWLDEE